MFVDNRIIALSNLPKTLREPFLNKTKLNGKKRNKKKQRLNRTKELMWRRLKARKSKKNFQFSY